MSRPVRSLVFASLLGGAALLFSGWAGTPNGPTGERDLQPGSVVDTLPPMGLQMPMPLDSGVVVDTLPNGLVYYIQENQEPKQRAQLRLVVNAGSIVEEEAETGAAHFLEHMLFNGTRRFEEDEIVSFMERIGMEFGPDVNAYTSFDETVYKLQIPTDSADIVQRSFDVLEDWARFATIAPEEVEKERGVILEEWRRMMQSAQGRMLKETLPLYLHDSPYAERLPIGDTTTVKNISAENLKQFYQNWYRPSLCAVVAVGDFEAEKIEKLIRTHFSAFAEPAAPPSRKSYAIPDHDTTLYGVVSDPEYTNFNVEITFKKDDAPVDSVKDYREYLVGRLFRGMFNRRLDRIERDAGAPFVTASLSRGSFVRPSEFYSLDARVQEDSLLTGLGALMTEVLRVRRHGFTPAELQRQKAEVFRAYESLYQERNSRNSSVFAGQYIDHYLKGDAVPGIAYEYGIVREYLDEISLKEVNDWVGTLLTPRNRVVIARLPESDTIPAPSERDLADVLDRVRKTTIAPYEEEAVDQPLLAPIPEPVAVTERSRIDTLNVTEVTLANGVQLIMKPTDFKKDQVRFTSFSPGGTSQVSDDDYFEAVHAASIVSQSGVGPFNRSQLNNKLAGKTVSVNPYINQLYEGVQGNASPDDLEEAMKLIHLYVTRPRTDSSAFVSYKNKLRSQLANRSASPMAAFQDSLTAALYGDELRRGTPTMKMVDTLSLKDAARVYRRRFSDAGDFKFVFVGNFDVDSLTTMAQRYLGTLPATGRNEGWRDLGIRMRPGVVTKDAYHGKGEKSQTALVFHDSFDFNRTNRHRLRFASEVLQIKLRENLREQRGAVYSVYANANTTSRPYPHYQFIVAYTSAPDSAESLVDAVFREMDNLKQDTVGSDYIERVKAQQRRQRETSMETNDFWLSVLQFYYSHPNEDVLDVYRYDDLIESLTAKDVQQAAQTYWTEDQYAKVILYPERSGLTVPGGF